jgi:hypothetical protein
MFQIVEFDSMIDKAADIEKPREIRMGTLGA